LCSTGVKSDMLLLQKEHKLKLFENNVCGTICDLISMNYGQFKILHSEVHHALYRLPSIVMSVKYFDM
jgi:hypothetical protein